MEPGTLGLEGRDLTTAPTPPLLVSCCEAVFVWEDVIMLGRLVAAWNKILVSLKAIKPLCSAFLMRHEASQIGLHFMMSRVHIRDRRLAKQR